MKQLILFFGFFPFFLFSQQCDTLLYSDGVNFYPDSIDAPTFTVAAIDNDSNAVATPLASAGITSEWQIFSEVVSPGDTNYFLGATSWFAAPDTADNWLIFGATTIPSTGAILQWEHMFADNNYRDGYEVLITATGNTINDFLASGTVVYSTVDNDVSTDGDTVWTTQTVNIDSALFGGQQVFIAFHHNAYDMFFLFLDDFLIKDCFVPCPVITVSATLTNPTSCVSANGSIDVAPLSGTSPYSYNWSNGQTNSTATGLGAGTYTVTITDASACSGDTSFTLTSPSGLSVLASATDETAPGANDGTASAAASGGTSPYSYNWSNGAFTQNISNLAPGTYTVTVTDASGCTATSSATVNPYNCTLTTSATSTAETAPNADDGTATATASGGTTPYSYNWSDGQITITATGLAPGNYSVTVTDAVGCQAVATTVVDSFVCAFSATATSTPETSVGASDGTASVTASGGVSPYLYIWSNGDTTSTITGLSPGTYSVTVTDVNNCSATASATVSGASLCNIVITNVSITSPLCNGGSDGQISVTNTGGTGTITFTWSNGNTGNTAYNLSAGSYGVTISDINSCTADTMVSVTELPPLSAVISTTDETCSGCDDGTAGIAVAGGTIPYSFSWINGQTSPNIDSLAPGIYSVIVTDANGCILTASDTVLPAVLEVEELETGEVKIFPNPNDGKFKIQHEKGKIQSIEIYNILGETVYQSLVHLSLENTPMTIDISQEPKGIYFVKIKSDGKIFTEKIIVE